jgi:hypothetical protein
VSIGLGFCSHFVPEAMPGALNKHNLQVTASECERRRFCRAALQALR